MCEQSVASSGNPGCHAIPGPVHTTDDPSPSDHEVLSGRAVTVELTRPVVAVASNKSGVGALERAEAAGVATGVFPIEEYGSREERDGALGLWLSEQGAEVAVLAGYMHLRTAPFLELFPDRIVNVHPALLPSFPGLDAIGQALEHGVRVTGVTVHFVDEGTDTGPVIMQRAVEIPANWDREELENRIHAIEHEIYPEAIGMIARGEVRIAADNPRQVIVDQ